MMQNQALPPSKKASSKKALRLGLGLGGLVNVLCLPALAEPGAEEFTFLDLSNSTSDFANRPTVFSTLPQSDVFSTASALGQADYFGLTPDLTPQFSSGSNLSGFQKAFAQGADTKPLPLSIAQLSVYQTPDQAPDQQTVRRLKLLNIVITLNSIGVRRVRRYRIGSLNIRCLLRLGH